MLKRSFALTLTVLAIAAVLLASSLARPVAADHTSNRIQRCGTIDQSGSYVLDRTIEATGDCLVITTSHVTIDLGGYTITGNGTGVGIQNLGAEVNAITIRNGTVTNFSRGVVLGGRHHIVDGVRAIANVGGYGIFLTGLSPAGNTVRNSIGSGTQTGVGIFLAGTGNSVIGNVANSNREGITVSCPSTIVNNVATGNTFNINTSGVGCTRHANSPSTLDISIP